MSNPSLEEGFWEKVFLEDAPEGDKTSESLQLPKLERSAKIIAKKDLSLSGADLILQSLPKNLQLTATAFYQDGDRVYKGQCIALLEGLWSSILLAERPLLNWIGHFSGIASSAWDFQNEVKHTKCKILDTRKTTPLYRDFEKKAVKDGGAYNHRANLSAAMMLKENHLSLYNFDIAQAIEDCITKQPSLHLTVEVSSIAQIENVIKTKAHRIMLDNFNNDEIRRALELIKEKGAKIEVEASGNMSLDRVQSVAELGVDFISVGAITHSSQHADISLLMDF